MGTTSEIIIQVQKKILRQGLGWLMKRKLFSDEEYVEMYRCVMDTLEDSYELSDEHKKMLDKHSVVLRQLLS